MKAKNENAKSGYMCTGRYNNDNIFARINISI